MNKKFDIYEWLNDNYNETKDTYRDIAKELAFQLYEATNRNNYYNIMNELKDNLDYIFEEEKEEAVSPSEMLKEWLGEYKGGIEGL